MIESVGILHPGEMGSSLAQTVHNTVGKVYWCSQGRSEATRTRAEQHGLLEITTLTEFCQRCALIIGVCPPHAAQQLAQSLVAAGYQGLYLEANAIAPATVQHLAAMLAAAGITLVDGGIVGLPAKARGTTWLYLSGPRADEVRQCFTAGPFESVVLGPHVGQASALKMLYAAWNKGKTALWGATLAAAEHYGVRNALEIQFDQHAAGQTAAMHNQLRSVARKAWRFTGEMEEIAATLAASGAPPEFFVAAAEVYHQQRHCKDRAEPPPLPELLHLITKPD